MNVLKFLAVWFMISMGATVLLCRAINALGRRWEPETRALDALEQLWERSP